MDTYIKWLFVIMVTLSALGAYQDDAKKAAVASIIYATSGVLLIASILLF